MVSLARKPHTSEEVGIAEDAPHFPHSMFLDGDEIDRLGIKDLDIGDKRVMRVAVKVTDISQHKSEGQKEIDRSITLTFIEADISDSKAGDSAAKRMFGASDDGRNNKN